MYVELSRSKYPNRLRQLGFTMIEMTMMILIVVLLATIAIPQFLDFQTDAKTALAQSLQSAIQTGIVTQRMNMLMRCGAPPGTWPAAADIQANDITNGGSFCTAADIPVPSQRKVLMGYANGLPVNPLGNPPLNIVINCIATGTCGSFGFNEYAPKEVLTYAPHMEASFGAFSGASNSAFMAMFSLGRSLLRVVPAFAVAPVTTGTPCGGAGASYSNGWCYNSASGGMWADAKSESSSVTTVIVAVNTPVPTPKPVATPAPTPTPTPTPAPTATPKIDVEDDQKDSKEKKSKGKNSKEKDSSDKSGSDAKSKTEKED